LNKGKKHQPIYKVRVYEKAEKFTVGQKGNKRTKFVEAAKGTNLFSAICYKYAATSWKRTIMMNWKQRFAKPTTSTDSCLT
jgi:CRISPR-associated endonuclease Csn1